MVISYAYEVGIIALKILALVPIRHHSQRVPGKNYRPLAGKPLFHHIISTLLACPEISQVVVDTDSPPVIKGLRQYFPAVRILERPEALRADTVPMNEILIYDTSQVEADLYMQTHTTNPLLRQETVSRAIQALLATAAVLARHQAQIGDGNGGYLFGETPGPDGQKKFFTTTKEVVDGRVKPAGEWNTLEITAQGKTLSLWVNGAVTGQFNDCGSPRGLVGLEGEGYRIEFRNLKVKELR